MIVREARNVTHADAGTLHIVDSGEKLLRFQIIQNDSLNIRIGGTTGKEVPLAPIPLEVRGEPNYANVSSYAALTGQAFVRSCNDPDRFLPDADLERLRQLARKTYRLNGRDLPYLTEDELYNLSTRKGSLTERERETIRQHVVTTRRILSEIPFPEKLRHVPLYAAGHHEKLDGSGYPPGLKVHQLPIQARIIAIADVFEALTARDRPYKDPLTLPPSHEDPPIHERRGPH